MNRKRLIFNIVFIATISFILCSPYIFSNFHQGHDGLFHLARLCGISEAIRDGQIIPRIYPSFNNNFGYGTPLFYCDFFLMPFGILYLLGLPLIVSFKLMLIFYTSLSVVVIFYVSNKIFKNNCYIPYITTILYSFASYHIIDLYVRVALGEVLAITFIPLLLYSFYLLFIEKKNCWLLLSTGFVLLLFSHNLSFALYCILFALLIILHFIFNRRDTYEIKRILKEVSKATVFAVLISAWFLFPMLEQTLDQDFKVNYYGSYYKMEDYLTNIFQLINPQNILILEGTRFCELTGPGVLLIFISLLYLYIKKNKYVTSIFIISWILLLIEAGLIPVYQISQLGVLQFLFRFSIVIFPLLVFISSYILYNISNKKLINVLSVIIIISSALTISTSQYTYFYSGIYSGYEDSTDKEILFDQNNYLQNGYNYGQLSAGDYLPAGISLDFLSYPKHIREMTGEYSYNEIIFDYEITTYSSKMEFTHFFEKDCLIMFPKTYYKGYQAFIIDGDEWINLETVNVPNYRLVGAFVPEGEHHILLKYSGTIVQKVSSLLSFASICSLLAYYKFILRPKNEKIKRLFKSK